MSYTSRFLAPGALIASLTACVSLGACGGTSSTDETLFGGDGGSSSTGQSSSGSPGGSSGGSSDGGGGACTPCLSDKDCGGGYCVQVASDSYCAASCAGGASCSADEACTALSTSAGQEVSACVPRGGVCGIGSGSGSGGSSSSGGTTGSSSGTGSSGGGSTCGTLVGPNTSAGCSSCSGGSSTCQPNGCYGGWWCDTATNKCQSPPSNCTGGGSSSSGGSGSSGSSSGGIDGGAPPTGTVGNTGGSVSRLYFAVVGDTRPPNTDDTSGYPTAIATKIFQDIQGMNPRPTFGVSTGDYMYATPGNGQAAPQLNLYVGARGNFTNVMFPAMGNHECTGYTASNCGSGNSDGVTENYTAFLNQMLQPIGQSNPYYAINVNSSSGAWTAKFVFVAANAWTSAQSSWLDSTLSQATTYTFIIRHESASANTAPGVSPAEAIYAKHPYTLSIVGHTHTYEKSGAKEVIFGNGGAPLSGGNYGFGLIQQRSSDNAIQVDMIDYQSLQPDSSFEFAVNPDGSAAP